MNGNAAETKNTTVRSKITRKKEKLSLKVDVRVSTAHNPINPLLHHLYILSFQL